MNGRYIADLRDCSIELRKIKTWIKANIFDSNVRFLTSYAVIRASGTIERVLKQMLFDCVSQGVNNEALYYFNKHIMDASFNPSTKAINRKLSELNPAWQNSFENVIKGSSQKGDLNSLINLRNDFAHGTPITSSIDDVIKYYISSVWILNELHKIIS